MISELSVMLPRNIIERFCRKWKIEELSIFGSALRDDFRPDSDLDILATFRRDANWSVFDHWRMSEELSTLLGRRVDIVEKADLNNPFRRSEILASRKVIYAG